MELQDADNFFAKMVVVMVMVVMMDGGEMDEQITRLGQAYKCSDVVEVRLALFSVSLRQKTTTIPRSWIKAVVYFEIHISRINIANSTTVFFKQNDI